MKRKTLISNLHIREITSLKYSQNKLLLATASADHSCCILNSQTKEKLVTLSNKHTEGLNDVIWLYGYSNYIATASDDKNIVIWDIEKEKGLTTLTGHQNFVFSLAVHPSENLLLSGSEDETVKMWDIRLKPSCVLSLDAHSEPVTCVQFHPFGQDIVTSSYDGLIRLWDSRNGALRRTISHYNKPPISYVRYTQNGRYLLTSSFDNTHRLIRPLQETEPDPTCHPKYENLSTVAARSTYRCVTGVFHDIKRYTGHTCQLYSSPTYLIKCNPSFSYENTSENSMELEKNDLNENFNPSNKRQKKDDNNDNNNNNDDDNSVDKSPKDLLISGSDDGKIYFWDVQTQEIFHTISNENTTQNYGILALDYNKLTNEIVFNGYHGELFVYSLNEESEIEISS